MEFAGILTELIESQRPDLMQPSLKEPGSAAYCLDPDDQAWSALATQRAVRILRERRRKDWRDTSS
jgi:hypothetical protein